MWIDFNFLDHWTMLIDSCQDLAQEPFFVDITLIQCNSMVVEADFFQGGQYGNISGRHRAIEGDVADILTSRCDNVSSNC